MPSLLDALTDFGAPRLPAMFVAPLLPAYSPPPAVDVASIVEAEVRRAEAAIEARMAASHAQALRDHDERHREEIAAMSAQFGDAAGQAIGARLDEMQQAVIGHVSAGAARVLGGIVTDDLGKRSIDALARAVDNALKDPDAGRITVRGPQSLFASLAAALGERAKQFDFIEAPSLDLHIEVKGDVLESRLGEWSASLSEILE